MTKLQGLELYGNRLTGTIPTELGRLTSMQGLHIDNNQLTGTIPAELGRLSNLRWLTLHDNRLTGEVPTELGRLTNLQQLYLSGNRFSGCVPPGLRGVSETDRTHLLKDIGIPYCDVLLNGLSITPGTLSPQFDEYATDYSLAAHSSQITVSLTNRYNATFEYLDGDDIVLADADRAQAGHQVDAPATMATTIKIKVTSSDGKANHTYTIQLTGPGALGAPEVHQVTAGTNSLTVSWTAPSSDGGSSITAYDLRHIRSDATNKGDANWTVVQDVWTGSGTRSYELAGLDGGTQYDVQVRAVNAAVDGPWSSTATGTPTSTETTPGSPANAQYVSVGSTTVVSWDPSTGATHYKLYHSDSRFARCSLFSSGSTSGCDELAANVTSTTYEHTSPDADTNNYWVTACNAAGCSEIDSGNPARFVDSRPAAPTGAQYVRVGSTAVVTWDPSAGATHYKVYYDDFFGTSCRLSSGSPSFCELLAGSVAGATYTHASPDEDRNYYWVVGCNSAGCSDIDSGNPATLVETTRSATAPGAPTRMTATANGQTRIELSWTASSDDGGSNITGYRIEVSEDGSNWSDLVANTNSTSTSYSHTGLTAGSTRHYRVSAINSVGTGTASNVDNDTTGAAPAPDLVVDSPTVDASAPAAGARFTLSATVRNQGNGSSAATTLRYYQSTDSTITTGDTEVGTDSVSGLNSSGISAESVSLTAPSSPGAYYYGACVDSASDESDSQNNCSSAVAVTVGASVSVPGALRGLTATADGQTRIDLLWTAPSDDGGADITGYRIEVSENGSTWSDLVANTNSTSTSYTHTGLMAGSTRYYQVSAINSAGTGPASNSANAITHSPTTPPEGTSSCATGSAVPNAANNPGLVSDCDTLLEARDTLAGTGTLNWSANVPIGNWDGITVGGTTQRVTRLELRVRVGMSVTGTIPAELGNLTNLEVLAIYGATTSDDQPIKLTGTIPAELGNLINLQELTLHSHLLTGTIPVELGGLTNLETLNLNFTQLSGAIPTELGGLNNLKTLSLYDNDLTGAIPVALGNLANLESLNLSLNRVSGTIPTRFGNLNKLKVLSLGFNQFSGTIPTQLGNLSNLESLAMGFNRVSGTIPTQLGNLTNLKSLSLGGNQLTGTIPSELGGLTKVTVLLLDRNRLTGTIPPELSGLTMLRQLQLASNLLTGCIPAALREVESNDLAQLGLPDCGSANAPGGSTGLTATANGQTEIALLWTAPSDDGGADITGYRIEVSTDGSSWSDLLANTNSTSTSYSHTGLTAGSTRHYRVSAINSGGTGPVSNTDSATTDAATKPGKPTGLTATADGQTRIDLLWTAPSDDGGASITGYRIEVSTDGSSWSDLVANTNSTSTSYSHTGLTAESARHYRVSAINSAGTGPVSNTDNATTNSAPPPTRPTGVAVTGRITECSAEQVAQGVDSYKITIAGTLDAIRTVNAVTVNGSLSDGTIVGIDLVGDMVAGESASFNIISFVSGTPGGTCEVRLEWLEIN